MKIPLSNTTLNTKNKNDHLITNKENNNNSLHLITEQEAEELKKQLLELMDGLSKLMNFVMEL